MTEQSHAPLVLGIETSCDETGIGLVRGTTLLADAIASSAPEHARFGGVVPEVASRAHLEAMVPTIERACAQAQVQLTDVDAVAVTMGPGLTGALLVGVAAAKALALGLGVPLYGVNHLAAHVAVGQLEHGPLPDPCMALLVSGGHSSILLVADVTADVQPLGATVDDAAGEAFDKVARVLGLPFPGGPYVDRAARDGDRAAIAFAVPRSPLTAASRMSSSAWRTSRLNSTRPGITFAAPGATVSRPTVATSPSVTCINDSIASTSSAAPANASARSSAGTVPA